MAIRVPRSSGPRVQRQGIPGPRAPQGAFGGSTTGAEVVADVSGVLTRIVAIETEKADQIAITDADNKLAASQDRILYDQNEGVLQGQGKDAIARSVGVSEKWDKDVSQIEGGLTTERQRRTFRENATKRGQNLHTAVQRHVGSETRRYDDEVTTSAIENRLNDALTHYGDPEKVGDAIADTKELIAAFAWRNGMSDEWVEKEIDSRVSGVHVGVLSRMLTAGQDQAATQYYAEYKGVISGDAQEKIEKALDEGSTMGKAQRNADRIMALPELTRTLAFEEAKKLTDPKERRATEQELEVAFARKDRESREEYAGLLETSWRVVEAGRMPPANLSSQLQSDDRRAMRSYLTTRAKGDEIETDWTLYYELKGEAADPATRNKFLTERNLLSYRHRLGDSEWKELLNAQNAMKSGKDDSGLASYQTHRQIEDGALDLVGIDPTPTDKEDKQRVALFRRLVGEKVISWQRANNKDTAPDDVIQKIADDVLISGADLRGGAARFFGAGAPPMSSLQGVYGQRPEQITRVDHVPAADRLSIANRINQLEGRAPTDQEIVDAYRARVTRLRGPIKP